MDGDQDRATRSIIAPQASQDHEVIVGDVHPDPSITRGRNSQKDIELQEIDNLIVKRLSEMRESKKSALAIPAASRLPFCEAILS